ncbi:MAG: ribbon-helix-helix protein, CopG family [Acidimicrobiia bacterium]|nr:ribbon-helix-helix protein, CopG family [Acidimicrobiia bacterium]
MPKRLNLNLGDEVAAALEAMAKEDGVTVTEMVRRSISTEKYLREARADGDKLLLFTPDSNLYREVVFR